MGKCLIVSMFSRQETGYASHYTDSLKAQGADYDILYFERYQAPSRQADNELVFFRFCPTGGSRFRKLGIMAEYAAFIRRSLRKGSYTHVIVLTTVPAVFLWDLLLKDFRGRYILDIRDYTHEQNPLYYALVSRLVAGAAWTALSSGAFRRFLPERGTYLLTHNIPRHYVCRSDVSMAERPVIGFVGSVRYFEENRALIRQITASGRYRLAYYGTTTRGCDLEGFCRAEGIVDVAFYGPYDNAQKGTLYENIHIINAIYGLNGLETTTAIPNRLYDAAIYRCPILVSKGTYLQEVVEHYGLGLAVDIHREDVPAALDAYLRRFDPDAFLQGCDALLRETEQDMAVFRERVDRFASDVKGGIV